jgi:AbrB family looped-hinge helix DNA binding protein
MATTTTIDRFGRVVIPRDTRDRFGLTPGTPLTIEDSPEGILLKPGAPAPVTSRGGVLVFSGEILGDAGAAVRRVREERLRRFWPRRPR